MVDFLSGATVPLAFMGTFGQVLGFLPFASSLVNPYTPAFLNVFDKKDYTIIGNSSSNLANFAFLTEDGNYWVDDDRKVLHGYDANGNVVE